MFFHWYVLFVRLTSGCHSKTLVLRCRTKLPLRVLSSPFSVNGRRDKKSGPHPPVVEEQVSKMASLKLALSAGVLSFLLISCLVIMDVVEAGDKPKKLQIGVKKKVENCEQRSKAGDTLHMHYTGTLQDGTEFDSSIPRGSPFVFTLGAGQVIKGWDQGLLNMCVGEKRKLVIPSDLGYGDRGSPPKIPGGATLVFEVELMKIDRKKEL